MIDPKILSRLRELRGYNLEIIQQVASFQELGDHTVDVSLAMKKAEALAIRAKTEVFGLYRIWRFRVGRARPMYLKLMTDISEEMEDLSITASRAWKEPDSQRIRNEESTLFYKREIIEGAIRDNVITLCELKQIAVEYKKRYGTHENLLTDRQFAWAQLLLGGLLGVVVTLLTQYAQRAL